MSSNDLIVSYNGPVGTMRLYGCGGGGVNIAKNYVNAKKPRPGIAEIFTSFIDTSRSNTVDVPNQDDVFVLPDLDGSGKIRAENHEAIAMMVPKILKDHAPCDLNVVIFTGAGGTGSVAGPLIMAELLRRGQNAVAVVIGSQESAITSDNTFKTLKSLDHISRVGEHPVVMYYLNNDRDVKRSDVDKEATFVISSLAVLGSRQNREMDSKDLSHWINFSKSTSVSSQLAMLKVFDSADQVDAEAPECFSMASLLVNEDETQPKTMPQYSSAGYYRPGTDIENNLFFCIETDSLKPIMAKLGKISEQVEESKNARVEGPSIVSSKDKVTGMLVL